MKIKTKQLVNIGMYEHLEFEIEVEVPDGLKNEELVKYLNKTYKTVLAEEPYQSVVKRLVDNALQGKPSSVFDYQKIENDDAAKIAVNEAKKSYKRSEEYKSKQVYKHA